MSEVLKYLGSKMSSSVVIPQPTIPISGEREEVKISIGTKFEPDPTLVQWINSKNLILASEENNTLNTPPIPSYFNFNNFNIIMDAIDAESRSILTGYSGSMDYMNALDRMLLSNGDFDITLLNRMVALRFMLRALGKRKDNVETEIKNLYTYIDQCRQEIVYKIDKILSNTYVPFYSTIPTLSSLSRSGC